MDFVRGIEVLGSSRFLGERIAVTRRLEGYALLRDNRVRSPRSVSAKVSDTEFKRSEKSGRSPISRRPKGSQWGEIEENVIESRNPVSRRPKGSQWGEIEEGPAEIARDGLADSGRAKPVKEGPGERFLNRAFVTQKDNAEYKGRSINTKSAVKTKKKKETVSQANLLNHKQPSCYGCGALLQTSEAEAPGYIPPQTFELKKKHHQLKTVLCGRCRLLSQGQMIPAVGGVGGYGSGKGYIPAEQLRAQLSHLRHQKALVVKLVDIVDFNGSFLGRVRDIVGPNPIILVLTKVDLLPNGTDLGAVSDWLQESVVRKKLNVISIHLTSSKAKTGISHVAADITRQRLGRDVYILGSANVGKSAFVTALLQDLSRRDPIAAAALRFKPIQSAMPGTTLGPIEFEAFSGGGKLYDTPGVHLHHRMAAALDPHDVSLLAPRRRLRGYVIGPGEPEDEEPEEESLFQDIDLDGFLNEKSGGKNWWNENSFTDIDGEQKDEQDRTWTKGGLSGYSLFWGGIARIDVIKAPEDLKFTFYGPTALRVLRVPTEEADDFYKENVGKKLRPPSTNTVGHWAGLEKVQELSLIPEKLSKQPAGDIAISGLGWFTIGKATMIEESLEGTNDSIAPVEESKEPLGLYNEDEEIIFVLHTPKAVEIFVRPSIPLGRKAAIWYEYMDLTDEELEARPQVFY